MRIFATGKDGIEEIREIGFKLESEIKRTVVDNFEEFFPNLELIESEFKIGDKRIDGLAFDDRVKAFVILEYKNVDNRDISDQVSIYYDKLQQNKHMCVNALSEKRNKVVNRKEISWEKTYLILVRPEFYKDQIQVSNSTDQRITKLYEIRKYPNHLTISQVNVAGKERTSIRHKLGKKTRHVATSPEYSEDDWLAGKYGKTKPTPQMHALYLTLKKTLLGKFQLEHIQTKQYAKFNLKGTSHMVCRVIFRKHKLQITYSTTKRDLLPINDFIKDSSPSMTEYNIGSYRSDITTESDILRATEYVGLVYRDASAV